MFRPFKITMNRVHDTVWIVEGYENLTLKVDEDPMRMTAGITESVRLMKTLDEKSTEEDSRNVALFFARVVFGKEQAEKLLEFYHNDAACVLSVCGQYTEKRLSKLIVKAQKKQ